MEWLFRAVPTIFWSSLSLALPAILPAQVTVKTSDYFTAETVTHPEGIFHTASGNLLYVRGEIKRKSMGMNFNAKCAIDVFSPDLKMIRPGKPVEVERFETNRSTRHFATDFGGQPALVFMDLDRNGGQWDIYRALISAEGVVGSQRKVGSVPGTQSFGETYLYFSCDSALAMLFYIPTEAKYRSEPFAYIIFDRGWNKLRSGTLQLPFENDFLFYEPPLLAKDASIWLPLWTSANKKGEIIHEIRVWRPTGKEPDKIIVEPGGAGLIYSLRLAQSAVDGTIFGGAVFTADNEQNRKDIFKFFDEDFKNPAPAQGVVYLKWSDTGSLLRQSVESLSADYLAFWSQKRSVTAFNNSPKLRMAGVYPLADGSVWLNVERDHFRSTSTGGYRTTLHEETCGCSSDPEYGAIENRGPTIGMYFSAEGNLKEQIFIKNQSDAFPHEKSTAQTFFIAKSEMAYWLYNGNPDEIEKPAPTMDVMKSASFDVYDAAKPTLKETALAVTTLDQAGNKKTWKLLESQRAGFHVVPGIYTKIGQNMYVFPGWAHNQYGLAKITFSP